MNQDLSKRKERHPSSSAFKNQDIRPLAKKQGHARKYCWGKAGTGEDGTSCLDHKDPNYNSDHEESTPTSPKIRKKSELRTLSSTSTSQSSSEWEKVLKEYFEEGDTVETAKAIEAHDRPETHHLLVKKGLTLAYECHAYQQELLSKLLVRLSYSVVSPEKMEDGFECALKAIEDSMVDDPDTINILARFVARAISDEVLPPIFIKNHLENPPSEFARDTLNIASGLLSESLSSEKLAKIWGPGDLTSVKRMKARVREMIEQYLVSDEPREVEDLLRKMSAPSFHFQVVRICVRSAIEKPLFKDTLLSLLEYLKAIGMLSPEDLEEGFRWSYEGLSDLKLDVPRAAEFYKDLVESARSQNLIGEEGEQSHA
eukprot:TRINITY_DN284_c0_g2_i1.p1 TRINITY_DN284_c0_g2~~TRINITY_DN284_c0_g2_i1.p1  ORF type:complete len:381 (-),score=69.35 TRINITY_DN284_c0_g2_i1:68-1180(-)